MMTFTRSGSTLRLLVIVFLSIVRSSHQTVYSCNANASCGCSTNSATLSRIVGGEAASSSTWGWAVSLNIGNQYLCGGSIISSSWVVTAAHCAYGFTASQYTVYAGSLIVWSGTQTRSVSQIIVHPDYNPNTYENDIALLQLSSPLSMNDSHVSQICLPSVSSATLAAGEWPPANTSVVAVGWGTLNESGSLPQNLQQVTVNTIDYQDPTCSGSIYDWHVEFCAGVSGGGKDTCQGDSGGPLMMFSSSNQWVLVGITSNGIGCARANYMGVYTRVATYTSWISSYTSGSVSTLTSSTSATASTSATVSNSGSSSSSHSGPTSTTPPTSTALSTATTRPASTSRSTSTTTPTSTTRSTSTTRPTSTNRSTTTTRSTSTRRPTSTTRRTSTTRPTSTTRRTSTTRPTSTTRRTSTTRSG